MKQKLKDFYNYVIKYYLWFILGVVTIKAIDLANYLMNYPSDITFYAGFFIYTICIGAIGYGIYSIITNNLKNKKNEN
jgi:hypothetical protein